MIADNIDSSLILVDEYLPDQMTDETFHCKIYSCYKTD